MCPGSGAARLVGMDMYASWAPRPLRRPPSLTVAHVLLSVQAVALALMWLAPNAFVALMVLAEGVPEDENAQWLFVPVIFTAPLLLFAVPAIVLALRFTRGRAGLHAAVLVFEALILLAVGVLGTWLALDSVGFFFTLPVVAVILPAVCVLPTLLTRQARAYFTRPSERGGRGLPAGPGI